VGEGGEFTRVKGAWEKKGPRGGGGKLCHRRRKCGMIIERTPNP